MSRQGGVPGIGNGPVLKTGAGNRLWVRVPPPPHLRAGMRSQALEVACR